MKLENVKVGMQVIVKKRAFETGGSFEYVTTVYRNVPDNRKATVLSIYGDCISVQFEIDSRVWTVSPDEIKPFAQKYYLHDDGEDIFIVEAYGSATGKVVCVIKGSAWEVGVVRTDWNFITFSECKFEVAK